MPQELPFIPTTPHYQVGTTLDGVQFVFDLRWNARDEAWYMDILAEDESVIRTGVKVVLGTLLGGRSALPGFPAGGLFATDLTRQGIEPGLDDLGTRVRVYFMTEAELLT